MKQNVNDLKPGMIMLVVKNDNGTFSPLGMNKTQGYFLHRCIATMSMRNHWLKTIVQNCLLNVWIMKKREITATGMINNNGGLQMYMGELNQFFSMHRGSRIIARFTVASPGSSEALKGYYFNYVVPTFRSGIWEAGERLTEEQTERRLRELSPVMYEQTPDINTGKYETRLRTIAELSNAELIEHIEHLKQIAAEEYNTFIDDPKTI